MDKLTHISTEVAKELTFSSYRDDEGREYTRVAKQFADKHRWYSNYLIVFEHGGTHYGFTYMEPATEYQEGQDCFLDKGGNVPVWEVRPEQVTSTTWKAA